MCERWLNCRRYFVVHRWSTVYWRLVVYMRADKTVLSVRVYTMLFLLTVGNLKGQALLYHPMRVISNFVKTGEVVCRLNLWTHKRLYAQCSYIKSPLSFILWWKISCKRCTSSVLDVPCRQIQVHPGSLAHSLS